MIANTPLKKTAKFRGYHICFDFFGCFIQILAHVLFNSPRSTRKIEGKAGLNINMRQ